MTDRLERGLGEAGPDLPLDGPAPGLDRPVSQLDRAALARAVADVLRAIGEDPDREGLRRTPERVAEMYAEIFSGLAEDPGALLEGGFDEQHEEMVVLRDIRLQSVCEHHLLPFVGTAHVGYIPRGRVVGIDKIARAVDILARRPQVQERLTSQIADLLDSRLEPRGVAVIVSAEHLCMSMRGLRVPGSRVVTSATRGAFRTREATRLEFLALLKDGD
ncbi:MAG: GTP cyclohydrolase I FolE [Chloroflexota bacterium]|nr:GTP cyclohydrolase I FolE [Chloroflexota bacterium]